MTRADTGVKPRRLPHPCPQPGNTPQGELVDGRRHNGGVLTVPGCAGQAAVTTGRNLSHITSMHMIRRN